MSTYSKYIISVLAIWLSNYSFGQYKISGYVESYPRKTVYLSLLKYDEETLINNDQILFSTNTDSSGYFEFTGQLLSARDKLYRIHANLTDANGLQLMSDEQVNNFQNFIFSNDDTVFFEKVADKWFQKNTNTNLADAEWRKLNRYERAFSGRYNISTNEEAIRQVQQDLLQKIKNYTLDSLKSPLVMLLAFSDIENRSDELKADFEKEPEFYYQLQEKLQDHYAGASYYLQYQSRLSDLSHDLIQKQYHFHRILNYILGGVVVGLIVLVIILAKKKVGYTLEESVEMRSILTNQEERIAQLIGENRSNKEIAEELFISLSTVKTHIRNLYAKLGVNDRQQLMHKFKKSSGY